jgi:hypothetical protein
MNEQNDASRKSKTKTNCDTHSQDNQQQMSSWSAIVRSTAEEHIGIPTGPKLGLSVSTICSGDHECSHSTCKTGDEKQFSFFHLASEGAIVVIHKSKKGMTMKKMGHTRPIHRIGSGSQYDCSCVLCSSETMTRKRKVTAVVMLAAAAATHVATITTSTCMPTVGTADAFVAPLQTKRINGGNGGGCGGAHGSFPLERHDFAVGFETRRRRFNKHVDRRADDRTTGRQASSSLLSSSSSSSSTGNSGNQDSQSHGQQTKTRENNTKTKKNAIDGSDHHDDDDTAAEKTRWVSWMTFGKLIKTAAPSVPSSSSRRDELKMREAEELGGIARSERYSSRYVVLLSI